MNTARVGLSCTVAVSREAETVQTLDKCRLTVTEAKSCLLMMAEDQTRLEAEQHSLHLE